MKSKLFLMILVVAAISSGTFGATLLWNDVSSNSNWSTVGNWYNNDTGTYPAVLPKSSDLILTGQGGGLTVDIAAVAFEIQLGSWGGNGALDVRNSLSIANALYAGVGSGTSTIDLNIASGSIISPYVILGHSANVVMNMSAGAINSSNQFGAGMYAGNTQVNITGGIITTDEFYIGHYAGAQGSVVLSGDGTIITNHLGIGQNGGVGSLTLGGNGKLVIGNKFNTPAAWKEVVDGWIGTTLFNAQTTIVGNTLEITAIPEPATMLLLGLGGVLLRRKRA